MWVKLLHYWQIIIGETYFKGEELHEILQNSSNEEYTENKHSEGSNAEIDMEVDETEESTLQGKDDGRKKREAATALHTMNQTLSYNCVKRKNQLDATYFII